MTSVPVYVIPADAADADTATVQRIVQQMVANDRRKDLTNGQRARAIQQMLDTGMSATKVAKKLRRGRDFARQRWPFGQFRLTRAGGFLDWDGCPATSSVFGMRIC